MSIVVNASRGVACLTLESMMASGLRILLAMAGLAMAGHAAAQVTFYEREDFQGRAFTAAGTVENFERQGFSDRASSVVVQGNRWERWEVCEDRGFRGRCVVLRPGQYSSMAALGLNDRISSVRAVERSSRDEDRRDAPVPAPQQPPQGAGASQIDLYAHEGFQGRSFTTDKAVTDFRRIGFNERASSLVVSGGRWELCQDARFGGDCAVLRPGQYPSLEAMGVNDQISSVRAVVEDSGRRCWVEPQQTVQERSSGPNVPRALLGAVLGGILGRQVGGGSGRDLATGVGVVAGAAIGGNSGRGEGAQQVVTTQNVERCASVPGQARAAYWDVTYNFRGLEHRVQMNRAPGRTLTVNEQGEPRA